MTSRTVSLPMGIVIPDAWRITRRVFRPGYVVTYLPTGVREATVPTLSEALDFINVKELELYAFSITGVPSQSGKRQLAQLLAGAGAPAQTGTTPAGGTLVLVAGDPEPEPDPSIH